MKRSLLVLGVAMSLVSVAAFAGTNGIIGGGRDGSVWNHGIIGGGRNGSVWNHGIQGGGRDGVAGGGHNAPTWVR